MKGIRGWMGLLLGLLATVGVQAQHGHMNAGAKGTEQGSQLAWINGALFVESSGYVGNMLYSHTGTYAGHYNSGPSLTALPATVANGGPSGSASALGSFLEFRYTVVAGPDGGEFSFWDGGAALPITSMGVGQTSALFPLSGGEDNPSAGTLGGDPYGHLHGRRFSADLAGDYIVAFQVVDTSVNGLGGGPIHTPSELLNVRFRVVPEPEAVALMGVGLVSVLWMARRKLRGSR